ncbi:MAG: hypothetical protein ACMUIU_01815 [bacterium]
MKRTIQNQNSANATSRMLFSNKLTVLFILMTFIVMLAGYPFPVQGSGDDAFFIDGNGNVGIGTNNPEATLDVKGNLKAQELEIDGNTVIRGNVSIGSGIQTEMLNVKQDINVNGGRVSDYHGFPKADFSEEKKAEINKTYEFTHNFNQIPSLVQVWVKSDSKDDVKRKPKDAKGGVYKEDVTEWKMAGVLSLYNCQNGYTYGTVVESIDEKCIIVRTGNDGLWHGHRVWEFFQTGSILVRAWK